MGVVVQNPNALSVPRIAFKRSASPLTTGTLWTYTGGILIRRIVGVVRTAVQAQITNTKISVKNDALAAVDLCASLDITGAVVGSIFQLPAALASAMVKAANGAALGLSLENTPIETICTTTGIITVTYGAASTGVIDWYMRWEALTPDASVT